MLKGSYREAEMSSWDTNPLSVNKHTETILAQEIPEPETADSWKNIGENIVYRHMLTATAGDEIWGDMILWFESAELLCLSVSVYRGVLHATQRSQKLGTCGWSQLPSLSVFPTSFHLLSKTVLI